MLAVLSPAKTLDFESDPAIDVATTPDFAKDAATLVTALRKLGRDGLQDLMGLSDDLADVNHRRYKDWRRDPADDRTRQAILAYRGDVYRGLDVDAWTRDDLLASQERLRILSGLYGVLRPLDAMQPHRLEMGTPLSTARGANLYDFWGTKPTDALRAELDHHEDDGGSGVLVHLASNEYVKVVRAKELGHPVVTCVFQETRDGTTRSVPLFSKMARGMMASFIVRERVDEPAGLRDFRGGGYRFRAKDSDERRFVFTRKQPPPVR